jgi:hypothetical protein
VVERDGVAEDVPERVEIVPVGLARFPQCILACAMRGHKVHEVKRGVQEGKVCLISG